VAFEIKTVKVVVLEDIDRFFQTVENETVRVEPFFTETEQHRGSLIEYRVIPFEYAARTAGIVAFIDHGHL